MLRTAPLAAVLSAVVTVALLTPTAPPAAATDLKSPDLDVVSPSENEVVSSSSGTVLRFNASAVPDIEFIEVDLDVPGQRTINLGPMKGVNGAGQRGVPRSWELEVKNFSTPVVKSEATLTFNIFTCSNAGGPYVCKIDERVQRKFTLIDRALPTIDSTHTTDSGTTFSGSGSLQSSLKLVGPDGSEKDIVVGLDGKWNLTVKDAAKGVWTVVQKDDLLGEQVAVARVDAYMDVVSPSENEVVSSVSGSNLVFSASETPDIGFIDVYLEVGGSRTFIGQMRQHTGMSKKKNIPRTWELKINKFPLAARKRTAATLSFDIYNSENKLSQSVKRGIFLSPRALPTIFTKGSSTDASFSGTGEPSAALSLMGPDGSVREVVVGLDGKWNLTVKDAAKGVWTVVQTDEDLGKREAIVNFGVDLSVVSPSENEVVAPGSGLALEVSASAVPDIEFINVSLEVGKSQIFIGQMFGRVGAGQRNVPRTWELGLDGLAFFNEEATLIFDIYCCKGADGIYKVSQKIRRNISAGSKAPLDLEVLSPGVGSVMVKDDLPAFTGLGDVGAAVSVMFGNGAASCSATVDPQGHWACTPIAKSGEIASGEWSVLVTQTPLRGSKTEKKVAVTVVDSVKDVPLLPALAAGLILAALILNTRRKKTTKARQP